MASSSAARAALNLTMDETPTRWVTFAVQVEESLMDTDSLEESLIDKHCHGGTCDGESDGSGRSARIKDCDECIVTDEPTNSVSGIDE